MRTALSTHTCHTYADAMHTQAYTPVEVRTCQAERLSEVIPRQHMLLETICAAAAAAAAGRVAAVKHLEVGDNGVPLGHVGTVYACARLVQVTLSLYLYIYREVSLCI